MRAHRPHAGVQEHGCGALGSLAVNDDNSVKTAAAGGITDVLTAMRAHRFFKNQSWYKLYHHHHRCQGDLKLIDTRANVDVLKGLHALIMRA